MAGDLRLPPPDKVFTVEAGKGRAYARLAYWFEPLHWTLTDIFVPYGQQGNGIGSQLLRMVVNHADEEGLDICLSVQPEGGLSYEKLVEWYARYGFIWEDGIMKRYHIKQEIA